MNKVKAFIEKGTDGTYSVYVDLDNNSLNYGIHGVGDTVELAMDDFNKSYLDMKTFYKEEGKNFVEAEFEFQFDAESFLKYYSEIFSKPALEKITGINQKQLHHYASGIKKPREAQRRKIETALHNLGKELLAVRL